MSSASRRAGVAGIAFASAIGLVLTLVFAGASAMAAQPRPHAKHATSTAGMHPHRTLPTPGTSGTAAPNVVPFTDQGAGYFNYPSSASGLASVSATFVMPTFNCVSSTDSEWLLPGIWVFAGGSLSEQVDVNFNCNNGSKLQEGIICLSNTGCDTSLVVNPGDKIIASLAYTPTATVATLKNATTHLSMQLVGGVITTDEVVLVGEIGPDLFGPRNVPQFSNLHFSAVQINGQYLADGPFPTRYNLKTDTKVQIWTSPISGDGAQFTSVYKHT